jgi:hypothetical protein
MSSFRRFVAGRTDKKSSTSVDALVFEGRCFAATAAAILKGIGVEAHGNSPEKLSVDKSD